MKSKQRLWAVGGFFRLSQRRLGKMKTWKSKLGKKMIPNIKSVLCNSSSGKMKTTLIYDLPEEVLTEILIRLPIKYLLRCRSVQKSWYYLIKTPIFITLHLNYQKKKIIITTHPKYLICLEVCSGDISVRIDDIQCEEYNSMVKNLPDLPKPAQPCWFAQSYGLICVSNAFVCCTDNIYLWNPLTEKYKTLPKSPLLSVVTYKEKSSTALAFGFVPQVNDYVVVQMFPPPFPCEPKPDSIVIGVYSLNTDSWKKITLPNVFISHISRYHHIFVNGVAFWLGNKPKSKRQIIVCFDTKTDILREISLPDWVESRESFARFLIHPYGQNIAYFVKNSELNYLDMWVLNCNPISEFFWEKKMSVSLSDHHRPEVLGLRNNGEPILFNSYDFISYNLDSHEAYDFVNLWDHWGRHRYYDRYGYFPPTLYISPFVESLVLLDID